MLNEYFSYVPTMEDFWNIPMKESTLTQSPEPCLKFKQL